MSAKAKPKSQKTKGPKVQTRQSISVQVRSDLLGRLIANVLPFASTDDARPILTGIYLRVVAGQLVATTTDSYMLGEDSIPVEQLQRSKLKWLNKWKFLLAPAAAKDLLSVAKTCVVKSDKKPLPSFVTLTLVNGNGLEIEASLPYERRLVLQTFGDESIGYPDTDKIFESVSKKPEIQCIPPFEVGSPFAFNPGFIAKLAKVDAGLADPHTPVVMSVLSPSHPFSLKKGPTFRALLMPVRTNDYTFKPLEASEKSTKGRKENAA